MKKMVVFLFALGVLCTGIGFTLIAADGDADTQSTKCKDVFSDCTNGFCNNASSESACVIRCKSAENGVWFNLVCNRPTQNADDQTH